jgi:hypothetical protein
MSATTEKTDFTIDQQWRRFMERCGIDPETFPEIQVQEMSRAFYGAMGQMLLLFRDELADLSEEDGIKHLEKMLEEVVEFWTEQNRLNDQQSQTD